MASCIKSGLEPVESKILLVKKLRSCNNKHVRTYKKYTVQHVEKLNQTDDQAFDIYATHNMYAVDVHRVQGFLQKHKKHGQFIPVNFQE